MTHIVDARPVPAAPAGAVAPVVIPMLQRDRAACATGAGVAASVSAWVMRHVESDLGGVQTHVDSVRQALQGLGDEVDVVTAFSGSWAPVLLSAAVARLLWSVAPPVAGRWHRWWHTRSLERAMTRLIRSRDDRPITFYAQCPTSLDIARRAAVAGDRVVSAVHFAGSEANDMAARGACRPGDRLDRSIRAFERRTLPTADGLVFVSNASVDPVLEEYPVLAKLPRRVLPNFLDDEWAGHPAPRPPVDPYTLVTIGRLEPRKNHRYGLEIVAAAASQGVRFELTVVGSGPELDHLQRLAEQLGIADQVTFAGRQPDVRPFLTASACYLHTAVNEPFGYALIESMALGLPIAAVPTGGMGEVFFDPDHGRYLPGDDAAAAATIVIALTADHKELDRIAESGRTRFRTTFTRSAVARRLQEFLVDTR